MPATREDSVNIGIEQALALALLVDLEAHWENMRKTAAPAAPAAEKRAMTHDLLGRQRAYETFREKLVAYNKRYTPAYTSELLLNNPLRLGAWCRAMRDLYRQVEHAPESRSPVHLLEKAYRCADRIGVRMNKSTVSRSPRPASIGAVIEELEVLILWCENLTSMAAAG